MGKIKEITAWSIQFLSIVLAAALTFFGFVPVFFTGALIFLLLLNAWILASIFSDFKKGIEAFHSESEKKTVEINEFDKITRQLVKRDLELARANQRLAELDIAKSDFISVAAHQLRTPLTGIKWSYTALLDPDTGPLNEDQKQIAEKGLASISNTIDLINDLLNVAHLEEGKLEFDIRQQPLLPIAKKAIDGIKLMAEEKNISIHCQLPDEKDFPEMNIDGEKIGLVLANILDNAVKYTPENGRIDYSISQEKGLVKIVIQDSGIGIPKSQKDRLFTKFFRAENAVSFQTSGTGLGLYMVKKVIDRHGGKIIVDSIEGKGTAFVITIPEKSAKNV